MKRKSILFLAALSLAPFLMAGCGPRGIRYTATLTNVDCTGKRSVAVAVMDERSYVVNREKDPTYVGVMRGGYGNPFNTSTQSGAPLADDILTTISNSLQAREFKVNQIKTTLGDSQTSVMTKFRASVADRLIFMRIKEWQSDYLPKAFTSERSNLYLRVDLVVFDRDQRILGKNTLQEELTLPSGWPEDTVPIVYQEKMKQLLDNPQICQSLS